MERWEESEDKILFIDRDDWRTCDRSSIESLETCISGIIYSFSFECVLFEGDIVSCSSDGDNVLRV